MAKENNLSPVVLNMPDLRAVYACLDEGLLIVDKSGEVLLANEAASSMLFIPRKGKSQIQDLFDIIVYGEKKEWESLIKMLGKTKVICFKNAFMKNDKIEFLATLSFLKVTWNEKPAYALVMTHLFRDIVEQTKSNFMSIVSHQVRTPMNSIRWNLEMLLDGSIGDVKPEQWEVLNEMHTASRRLVEYLDELLQATELDSNRVHLDRKKVDLRDMIDDIIAQQKVISHAHNVEVKNLLKEKKGEYMMMVDPVKLRMILQNLIDNAVKYNKPGGEVTVDVKKGEKYYEFMVKDSGIGIPDDERSHIFRKFFRGSLALQKHSDGTGVGLYICKGLAEAMDGKITFDSKLNQGTKFVVRIPVI